MFNLGYFSVTKVYGRMLLGVWGVQFPEKSVTHEHLNNPLVDIGLIQVLCNVVGGGVSAFPKISITKVYGSTLLALRGGG